MEEQGKGRKLFMFLKERMMRVAFFFPKLKLLLACDNYSNNPHRHEEEGTKHVTIHLPGIKSTSVRLQSPWTARTHGHVPLFLCASVSSPVK